MKSIRCMVSLLLGPILAVIALMKFIGVLLAALVGLAVVGAGLLAYLKREQWTKPAYRWVRDTSERWSRTPWPSAEPGAGEPEPVVPPIPADETVS